MIRVVGMGLWLGGMVARLRSRLSEALSERGGGLDWGDYGHGGGH